MIIRNIDRTGESIVARAKELGIALPCEVVPGGKDKGRNHSLGIGVGGYAYAKAEVEGCNDSGFGNAGYLAGHLSRSKADLKSATAEGLLLLGIERSE